MTPQNDCFVEFLEWESMTWPLEFSNIISQKKNYNLPKNTRFNISRDDEFKLIGKISGVTNGKNDIEYQGKNDEFFVEGDLIEGYDMFQTYKYEISDFWVAGTTFKPVSLPYDHKHSFLSEIRFNSIVENHIHNPNSCNKILEFYLVGQTSFLYPRSTGRSKEVRFTKRRGNIEFNEQPENIFQNSRNSGSDYMYIETDSIDFILQKVNNKFLPAWANGIQIEYTKEKQNIPSEEIRKGISEIVSFLFGTHALKIGETWLDDNNNIIKRIAQNPWGDNVRSKCVSNARPPFDSRWREDRLYLEKAMAKLIPTYLHLCDSLNLGDVLWKYWIAKELAIGTNLPILASAFESLAEDYINARQLIKTYGREEKKQYYDLIKAEQETLEQKLKKYDFKNRLLNNLKNPFSLGMGEKISLFAETLNLNITKNSIENEALKARNVMAHSSISGDFESAKKYVKLTNVYISLFHRTLLKILGHEGSYIDYSTPGYPSRQINETLG